MKKFLSAALALVMAASSTVTLTGAAEARHRDRHYGHHYYDRNYYDHYRYRRHHHNGDAVAAGVLGFALGAIIAGTVQRNYARRSDPYYARDPGWDHVRRCEARYRSYDRYSDTFIGRDGRRYYCTL